SVSATSYSDTGLSSLTSYSYTVAAYDAAGNPSAQSASVSAATLSSGGGTSSSTYPSMPTNLMAGAYASSRIDLSWTASTDDVGVTQYNIHRNGAYLTSVGGTVTSYSDTGLSPSTNYSYYVIAYDALGNYSPQSASASATTPSSGTATSTYPYVDIKIDGIDGTISRAAPASYTLTWSSSNASTCNASGTWGGVSKAISGNQSFTGVSVLGIKTYGLICSSSYGLASDVVYVDIVVSSTATTSTTTAPIAPASLATAVSGNNVTLTWIDASSNENRFDIFKRSSGGTWYYVSSPAANVQSWTINNEPLGTYEYYVVACNSAGCSASSNTASATISSGGGTATSTVNAPFVDIKVDGAYGTVSRAAPASYTVSWNTSGATSCVPEGTWGTSGAKSVPSGSHYFTGVTVLGLKTYALACNNSYGTARSTVYVDVVGSTAGTIAATLKGVVFDASGKTVPGASVHVFSGDFTKNFGSLAAADGTFSISLPGGAYFAEVFPPSGRQDLIKPQPVQFSVADGETKSFDLKFAAIVKTISGKVTFSNGTVVADAEVGAYSEEFREWKSAITQADGNYTIKVGAGKWKVGIRPRDSATASWSWSGPFPEVSFVYDSSLETRTVNFIIELANAKLIIRAKNEAGQPLSGAGIVFDTLSSGVFDSSASRPSPQFRKSDSLGVAEVSLITGTYFVRAFLPPDLGYINPDEKSIFITSGETKEITLVFRKPAARDVVDVPGISRFADGARVPAFIWAWSEKGGSAETRSSSDGSFSLSLSVNNRWHIGAGKELNSFPYKSSEIIVDTSFALPKVELVLEPFGTASLPNPVAVSQPATEQIVVRSTDGAQVTIPPSAAALSGTVNVEIKTTVEAPSQAASKVVSTVYDVQVKNAAGTNITTLQKETEIVIPYDPEELKKQGVTEDTVVPSFFDEGSGSWVKVDNYTIDKTRKVFVLRVKHLTRFALVAPADATPPNAPTNAAAKTGGSGETVVSWTNPTSDFGNAKVYRSLVVRELGKVVFNSVASIFSDKDGLVDGTIYYYTVRAVDPAGNESANVNQVAVTAKGTSAASKVSTLPPGQALRPGSGQAVKVAILRSLTIGDSGDDVTTLQQLLLNEGVYPGGLITGYFGSLTKQAVIRFQDKYADEILAPAG
ncbi:MAG: peptidoglycan-binding protein, partial [bacterium]|nr:peptidoglycan-binding protein [bacterium]